MTKTDLAVVKMSEGYNCAQSIVAAFAQDVGLDVSSAIKMAGVFGGGLAHQGHVCGAVSGALMIIGMKYNGIGTDYASREPGFAIGADFIEEFEARHQSIDCRQLIGCDLSAPEGLKRFKDSGIFENVCPHWVKEAADILDSLL
jgi:C_GCAxxG_C_C family probable redox protein